MSFLPCLIGLPVLLAALPPLAGAQESSPPPVQSPFGMNPTAGMLAVLVAAVALFVAIYAIYLLYCSGFLPPVPGGSTRGGRGRRAAARGLDPAVIDTFPTLVYSDVKGLRLGKGALECVVCLSEFEDDETLRLIPKCDHVFHPDCIGEWLAFHTTCPVCRAELAPKPGESTHPPPFPPADSAIPRGGDEEEPSVHVDRNGDVELGQEPSDLTGTPNQSRRGEPGFSLRTRRFPRSHSTGHSLVQPGENTERFTLRLPVEVRKQVMEQAESSRRGNRANNGEGSSRGKYLRRPQLLLDRAFKSDRWVLTGRMPSFFFTRSTSAASPITTGNGVVEGGSLGRSIGPARPPI